MYMREYRGRPVKYESGLFSDVHEPILQAWVDGIESTDEIARFLGKKASVIHKLGSEITSIFMNEGPGRDNRAKALVYAVVHNLVDFSSIDAVKPKRKLSNWEIGLMTAMATKGLDNTQMSKDLSIPVRIVKETKRNVEEALGVPSIYTALAWMVRRSIQRLREQAK